MEKTKELNKILQRINDILLEVQSKTDDPEKARKDLQEAVVGHRDWSLNSIRELGDRELHKRALAAVTDVLVEDLRSRRQAEILTLVNELDTLRKSLSTLAMEVSFELLDVISKGRNPTIKGKENE